MKKIIVVIGLTLSQVFLPLHAADPFDEAPFISLTRSATSLSSLPTNVSIINQEQIRNSGAQSVADVLDLATSIDVSRSGSLGTLTTARIRGVPSSANTQILINNQPANGISFQFIDLAQIPVDHIDRIEIIRGGASVLYGANTTAGVINIITQEPTDEKFSVGLAAQKGSFQTEMFNERLNLAKGPWGFAATGRQFHTAGFQRNGAIEQNTVTGTAVYHFSGGSKISADLMKNEHDGGDPQGTLIPPDQWDGNKEREPVNATAKVERRDINGRFNAVIKTGSFSTQLQTFGTRNEYRAIDPMFPFEKREKVIGSDLKVSMADTLIFGGSMERDQYYDVTANTNDSVRNTSVYLLTVLKNDRAFVSPAVRIDRHSEFGTTTNPRIATSLNLTSSWSISANAGRSFRTPTFFELFYENGTTQIRNPQLKPQTAYSYDVGQRIRVSDRQEIKITAFYTDIRDQIQTTNNMPWLTNIPDQYINHSRSEINGIETEWTSRMIPLLTGELDTSLNYTYQRAIGNSLGRSTYQNLKYTPTHIGNLQVTWRKQGWIWSHIVKATSDQFSGDAYTGLKMSGYATWDSTLRKKIRQFELMTAVKNITNKRYTENAAFGAYYPEPTRSYWAGLNISFASQSKQ